MSSSLLPRWEPLLSVTTEKSSGTTAVRPFMIPVTPEAELEALRARITATRWPDQEPRPCWARVQCSQVTPAIRTADPSERLA